MFELNGVSLPLDVDDLSVVDRIDNATRKMKQALKSVAGKPRVEHNIVASLRKWCNEVFADDGASGLLLAHTSLRKILSTVADIAAQIGEMRKTNTLDASSCMEAGLKEAMVSAGLTEEEIQALAMMDE